MVGKYPIECFLLYIALVMVSLFSNRILTNIKTPSISWHIKTLWNGGSVGVQIPCLGFSVIYTANMTEMTIMN